MVPKTFGALARACWFVTCFLTGAGMAQPPARDVVLLGDHAFVRTQVQANMQPRGVTSSATLSAGADGCLACFVRQTFPEPRFVRASQFGYWGEIVSDIGIDPVASQHAITVGCGRGPVDDWIVWHTTSTWARRLDDEGVLVGETFLVDDSYAMEGNGDNIRLAFTDSNTYVVMNTGFPATDIRMRVFSLDGFPLSGVVPVSTDTLAEKSVSTDALSDGGLIVGYIYGTIVSSTYYPYLRRVFPDYSVSEPVQVSSNRVNRIYVRALDDGTVLVAWRESPTGSFSYVQRYTPELVPLGDAVPIEPGWWGIAANSHGEFVVVGRVQPSPPRRIWVQFYDKNWSPLSAPFNPVSEPPLPDQYVINNGLIAAYGDNGDIRITWEGADSSTGQNETFLTTFVTFLPGDMNRDGRVDNFDIDPFVLALTNSAAYYVQYNIPEDVAAILGDINRDGVFNNFDIDPFVMLLVGE